MLLGQLRARRCAVTRARVGQVMREIDPLNVALRGPRGLTTRRPYSVPGPNSLWHIGMYLRIKNSMAQSFMHASFNADGHHKLVRWRMVTHCGIDGYSRMIVYCRCSGNNSSSTVYSLFLKATQHFVLPSQVRSDQGAW